MSNTVDACGLSCPQPVLMTLDTIKSGKTNEMTIRVDNAAAKENVSRAAASRGWTVADIREEGAVYAITIKKG